MMLGLIRNQDNKIKDLTQIINQTVIISLLNSYCFCSYFPECGGVIRKKQGHLLLESYPNNARCEWTIQVDRPFTIELK